MIAELIAQRALSADVIKRLSERAGGVPLFIEEVTRLILERGEVGGAKAIPPTLRQSFSARLDRLGRHANSRRSARCWVGASRTAFCATSRFTRRPPISAGSATPPRGDTTRTRSNWPWLLWSTRIFSSPTASPREASYRFKHALIKDAAYDSLLKSRRQALHRRAAAALIAAQSEPEAIAHHFTAARADDLAIEWWGNAGDDALRRSAFKEAIAHLATVGMEDQADGSLTAVSREFGSVADDCRGCIPTMVTRRCGRKVLRPTK